MPVVGRARLSNAARAGRGASLGKRRMGLPRAAASASKVVQRAESEAAALASITPFARGTDSQQPVLYFTQPPETLLVSASTYHVLTWGKDGHRKILANAPELSYEAAMHFGYYEAARHSGDDSCATMCDVPFTAEDVAAYRDEWDVLPYCVPQIPPREGHLYVMHEMGERLSLGGELYHRIFIAEGTTPKQVPIISYEEEQRARKQANLASAGARELYGETAPLGVKLITVKALVNGDCFFDAVCKAFNNVEFERESGMWAAARPLCSDNLRDASGSASIQWQPSTVLTVSELRAVVAAHYDTDIWMTGRAARAVGGEYFPFIVEDSLEGTRANIAKPALEVGDHAYWADESAIAVLQRYLHVQFLIFKPGASPGNQCACLAPAKLPSYTPPHGPPRFVLLRHSHRASKVQHYDGYALKTGNAGGRLAVFDDAQLPAGIKRAFAELCTKVVEGCTWHTA